jgi:hypothetical protein
VQFERRLHVAYLKGWDWMKTIKTIGQFKIKLRNQKELDESGYPYAVTMGEYDDVEFNCCSIKECEENIKSY